MTTECTRTSDDDSLSDTRTHLCSSRMTAGHKKDVVAAVGMQLNECPLFTLDADEDINLFCTREFCISLNYFKLAKGHRRLRASACGEHLARAGQGDRRRPHGLAGLLPSLPRGARFGCAPVAPGAQVAGGPMRGGAPGDPKPGAGARGALS